MKRLFTALFLTTICLPQTGCFGPNRCTERTPESFSTFREEQWSDYCADYKSHVESPLDYELTDLTKFLAAHPARVEELDEKLYRFEKYETCFQSPKEELELRELQSCLEQNDRTEVEVTQAWVTAADAWLEELDLKAGSIRPMVEKAEQEGERLFKKTSGAFAYEGRFEDSDLLAYGDQISAIAKELDALEEMTQRYDVVLAAAKGNEALENAIKGEAGPRVSEARAEAQQLRERTKALEPQYAYIEYATYAIGVPCPKGKRARKEERIAEEIVGGRNNEVRGSGIRIQNEITTDESGTTDYERFTGYICGVRSPEHQLEGAPKLCGRYVFVIERQKADDAEDWEDWAMKSFEESGPSGGIDCDLLTGKPRKKKRRRPVDDGY